MTEGKKRSVNLQRKNIEALVSRINLSQQQKSEKLNSLVEGLINGTIKSDDKIKDFVTAHLRIWTPEAMQPYINLKNKAIKNAGKAILVIKKKKEEYNMLSYHRLQDEGINKNKKAVGGPPRKSYKTTLELQLGILSKNLSISFGVQSGKIITPTSKHFQTKSEGYVDMERFPVTNIEWGPATQGPIENKFQELPHLYQEALKKHPMIYFTGCMSMPEENSEILFGSDIKKYFQESTFDNAGDKKYTELIQLLR